MSNTTQPKPPARLRYWLSNSRDYNGCLTEQSIRIEWDGHTACADLRNGALRWQNGTCDVPTQLADLALECALDAYEYGVLGCTYEGQETADEMHEECDRQWDAMSRKKAARKARVHYGQNEDHEFPEMV